MLRQNGEVIQSCKNNAVDKEKGRMLRNAGRRIVRKHCRTKLTDVIGRNEKKETVPGINEVAPDGLL